MTHHPSIPRVTRRRAEAVCDLMIDTGKRQKDTDILCDVGEIQTAARRGWCVKLERLLTAAEGRITEEAKG